MIFFIQFIMNPFQLPKPLYSLQEIIVSQKYNLAFKKEKKRQDQQRHQQRHQQRQNELLQAKQRIKQKKTVYLQHIQQDESQDLNEQKVEVMKGPPESLLQKVEIKKETLKFDGEIVDHYYNDDGTCFYKFDSSNQWVNESEIKSDLVKEYNDTIGSDLYTNIIHQVYNLNEKESWRQLIVPSQKGSIERFIYTGVMNNIKKNFLSDGNHLKLKSGLHIKSEYINDFKMYLKKVYPIVSIGRYGRKIEI
jgi:hypothetical protein